MQVNYAVASQMNVSSINVRYVYQRSVCMTHTIQSWNKFLMCSRLDNNRLISNAQSIP